MKELPKGEVIIIEPSEPETPDHLLKRIFGMTAREYAEMLLKTGVSDTVTKSA